MRHKNLSNLESATISWSKQKQTNNSVDESGDEQWFRGELPAHRLLVQWPCRGGSRLQIGRHPRRAHVFAHVKMHELERVRMSKADLLLECEGKVSCYLIQGRSQVFICRRASWDNINLLINTFLKNTLNPEKHFIITF